MPWACVGHGVCKYGDVFKPNFQLSQTLLHTEKKIQFSRHDRVRITTDHEESGEELNQWVSNYGMHTTGGTWAPTRGKR